MIIFKLIYDSSSSATLRFSRNFYLFFVYVQNLLIILDLFPQMAHHIMFSFNSLVLVIYGFVKKLPPKHCGLKQQAFIISDFCRKEIRLELVGSSGSGPLTRL